MRLPTRRAARAIAPLAVAVAVAAGCGPDETASVPVTEPEAEAAFERMVATAAERTPEAMQELCDRSLDQCTGLSGSLIHAATKAASSAPGPDRAPVVRCSRAVGDGAWMLVVAGDDGLDRPYVSQVVLGRDDTGDVVPVREPAFWLGIGYASEKVTGSTAWSAAYRVQDGPAAAHPERVLDRARRACPSDT